MLEILNVPHEVSSNTDTSNRIFWTNCDECTRLHNKEVIVSFLLSSHSPSSLLSMILYLKMSQYLHSIYFILFEKQMNFFLILIAFHFK